MFTLEQVVPWGRSFDEYQRMFALTEDDLRGTILGCGDGPASFNAEATRRSVRITSCDPVYQFDVGQLRQRIEETSGEVLAQTLRNADEFVWTSITSVDALKSIRMAAMETFLQDFTRGKLEGRYVDASLPELPFDDDAFDLALSSHFLFLYTTQLGEAFHRVAIREMCRVAREVRIFPVLALGGMRSSLVGPVMDDLGARGFDVVIEQVPYEFQRGGREMLRISRPGLDRTTGPVISVR
jgi:SAM-dependent methyltransferase